MKSVYFKLLAICAILLCMATSCNRNCPECPECQDCPECPDVIECPDEQSTIDSLNNALDSLNASWRILVGMYDSVIHLPPDTVHIPWIPQCTLCYESVDSVNGEQYYVGYDGKYYKLFLDSATLIRQIFINWIDTTITRYRFADSTIYLDSIITGPNGEKIMWSHTLCDKYLEPDDCGNTRLVLGQVLFQSKQETEGLTALMVKAYGTICNGEYPIPKISVNGEYGQIVGATENGMFTIDHDDWYVFNIMKSYSDIDSITIEWDGDCYEPNKNPPEDRNFYISKIKINGANCMTRQYLRFSGYVWWEDEEAADGGYVSFGSNGSMTIKLK